MIWIKDEDVGVGSRVLCENGYVYIFNVLWEFNE